MKTNQSLKQVFDSAYNDLAESVIVNPGVNSSRLSFMNLNGDSSEPAVIVLAVIASADTVRQLCKKLSTVVDEVLSPPISSQLTTPEDGVINLKPDNVH